MVFVTGLALAVVAVLLLFPETPVGRGLRRWLVEKPARRLNRATIWQILFVCGLLIAGLVMTLAFGFDGGLLYAMMAPEILVWAVMFDIGLIIDGLLITSAILASNGVRIARAMATDWIRRALVVVRTPRAARSRRPRRVNRPGRSQDPKAEGGLSPRTGPSAWRRRRAAPGPRRPRASPGGRGCSRRRRPDGPRRPSSGRISAGTGRR